MFLFFLIWGPAGHRRFLGPDLPDKNKREITPRTPAGPRQEQGWCTNLGSRLGASWRGAWLPLEACVIEPPAHLVHRSRPMNQVCAESGGRSDRRIFQKPPRNFKCPTRALQFGLARTCLANLWSVGRVWGPLTSNRHDNDCKTFVGGQRPYPLRAFSKGFLKLRPRALASARPRPGSEVSI